MRYFFAAFSLIFVHSPLEAQEFQIGDRVDCERREIARFQGSNVGGIQALIPRMSMQEIERILDREASEKVQLKPQSSEVTVACKNLIIKKGEFGAECDCPLD